MANYVGKFESSPFEFSTEIPSETFYGYIPEEVVPEKCSVDGNCTFFYYAGESNLPIEEANEFYIYNPSQGFLYKFLLD